MNLRNSAYRSKVKIGKDGQVLGGNAKISINSKNANLSASARAAANRKSTGIKLVDTTDAMTRAGLSPTQINARTRQMIRNERTGKQLVYDTVNRTITKTAGVTSGALASNNNTKVALAQLQQQNAKTSQENQSNKATIDEIQKLINQGGGTSQNGATNLMPETPASGSLIDLK